MLPTTANSRSAVFLAITLLATVASADARADGFAPLTEATVGRAATINQVVIPGSELAVRTDLTTDSPAVVRIKQVYPHGTDFRYDLVFYGLEPGLYDLTDYLKRLDGSSLDNQRGMFTVTVRALLPDGQIEPHALKAGPTTPLGGYRTLLVAGGIVWLLGLVLILFARRRGRLEALNAARAVTLADQLRPLVTAALAGKLSQSQQAELERLLVTYWRRRRQLDGLDAAAAMMRLREDAEAGPLLRQLEAWLHAPEPAGDADVNELLRPYQNLPPEQPSAEASREPALAGRSV